MIPLKQPKLYLTHKKPQMHFSYCQHCYDSYCYTYCYYTHRTCGHDYLGVSGGQSLEIVSVEITNGENDDFKL